MSGYTDQDGQPVTLEQMAERFAEAMLANLLVLREAGIARDEIVISVGHDGGTVRSRSLVLQTPIERRLPTTDATRLLETTRQLIAAYDAGRLSEAQLAGITTAHKVSDKIRAIQDAKRDRT